MCSRRVIALVLAIVAMTIPGVACNKSSPTSAMRAVDAAIRSKDAAAFRRHASAELLLYYEREAKRKGDVPVDRYIVENVFKNHPASLKGAPLETRGESITGNTATLQVGYGGDWTQYKFIFEDGEWKVGL